MAAEANKKASANVDPVYAFEAKHTTQNLPELRPGDVVRVHQEITEGDKTRVQVFEGTVIKINHGQGINGTFTVRRVSAGHGVERIFPFQMPSIRKVEITKRNKVRRAKLYYLRRLQQKAARLVEKKMSREELAELTYDADAIEAAKKLEEEAKKAAAEAEQKAKEEAEAKKVEEQKAKEEAAKQEVPKEEAAASEKQAKEQTKEKPETAAEEKKEVSTKE